MEELKKRYEIAKWIAGDLTGTLTASETEKLEAWRSASVANAREYEDIRNRLKTELQENQRLNISEEWQKLEARIPASRKLHRIWPYAAAACAVIGLIIGLIRMQTQPIIPARQAWNEVKSYKAVLILNNGQKISLDKSEEERVAIANGARIIMQGNKVRYDADSSTIQQELEMNTVEVPRGGEYELQLADGTKVWLNSESRITYPVRFDGDLREVTMEGEVCFEVARNEKQPFVVKTGKVAVTVLGTLFNMEAYPEERQVITTLVRGKVEVSVETEKRILTPDHQAIVGENGKIRVKEVYAEDYASWITGVFHFEEASLEEIMIKLARWYNVEVSYSKDTLKEAHFTLNIQRYEHISTILSKIEKTGRVKFRTSGHRVIVEE